MTDSYLHDRFDKSLDGEPGSPRPPKRDLPHWNDLDRQVKKALSRLLGGGSLRAIAPETVTDLRRLGLIEGNGQFARLTAVGWDLLRSSRKWLRLPTGPQAD
jgi:hypothetical protein